MNAHPKLTVEAIIRWEQMTGRNFAAVDLSSESDVLRLIYCMESCWMENPPTFDVYKLTFDNKKVSKEKMRAFAGQNEYMAQFGRHQRADSASTGADGGAADSIASIAGKLIVTGGMDARYVMREMPVELLPIFLDALNNRIRQEAESNRLWTYLQIRPHIDARKCNSPQKLFLFPWEQEDAIRKARETAEKHEQDLRRFLAGEMLDPSKVKWTTRRSNQTTTNHDGKE